jgi:hypothetical protein
MISCPPQPLDERGKNRIGDGFGDGLMTGQVAEIRKRRMRAVEHPELHVLIRRDIGRPVSAPDGS